MQASEFKRQFLPLSRHMYWTAWRLTSHAEEAEDLVQEAFLRLWTKREQLGEIENPEAYCTTLIRNLYLNFARQKRMQFSDKPPELVPLVDENTLEDQMALKDESRQVQQIIGRLPEQQRRVITLHDIEDYSNEEIREQTGLQPTHIRVLLSRARKAIRQMKPIKSER